MEPKCTDNIDYKSNLSNTSRDYTGVSKPARYPSYLQLQSYPFSVDASSNSLPNDT